MIIASSILPLILSVSTVVHAAPLNRRQQECSDIKIIVARGSTEPQGEGFTGAFATLVKNGPCAKDKKITSTALVYPAQLVPYTPSVNEGIKNMAALLESEVKNCPKQDLVLMGWSQGAHLIGSVLSGEKQFSNGILGAIGFFDKPAEPKMPKVPKGGLVALASQLGMNPLDAVDTYDNEEEADLAEEADGEEESEEFASDEGQDEEEEETETEESDEEEERRLFRRQSSDLIKELDKKVKAVIFLGDPTFLPGEPFDLGTNKDKTGLFPRTKGQLSQFASRIQSYCDTTDPFCQAGGALLPTHFGYFIKYDKDSAAFVNQKLCNAK